MEKELLLQLIGLLIKEEKPTVSENKEENKWGEFIGEYVILRWYDSWVHFWKLEHSEKWNYILSNTRRLWYWKCIKWLGLSSVAQYGLHSDSKITCEISKIKITDERISEILPCTKEAQKSIQSMNEYIPQD